MYNKNLYNTQFHKTDISNKTFLITGGAGFIGSNLVEYLLRYKAGKVRVLDNLSNGSLKNIEKFAGFQNFEFIEGDIRNFETCKFVLEGIEYVLHQAALGSVPRSIKDPLTTNDVNISGFLNILLAAKESSILKRFVYAASSSTYGDSKNFPKVEGQEGAPISPYAVTKAVNELYADVFSRVYNFNSIGLRYFNVFGPNQNPENPYAAVIPKFCQSFIDKKNPIINGDGETSRDFTFIENVVQANIKSLFIANIANHEVFNIACGDNYSLNDIIKMLNEISSSKIVPKYAPEREGDIKHSKADIGKATKMLGYIPYIKFKEGLKLTYDNYKLNN
jgi:UDP-N-acetylglucosamine 4-epimerase